MKQMPVLLALSLAFAPLTGLATDQFYINNGLVTFPPQVDAVNFINNGTFNLLTTFPFDTSNTKNFTNNGYMTGSLGYRFDDSPSQAGVRKPSTVFHNRTGGTVESTDFNGASFLLISATNIINQGNLVIGANGSMQLTGTNVNLTRSGILVNPILATGSFNDQETGQFLPDVAVYDDYWAQQTNMFDSSQLFFNFGPDLYVISPPHFVQGLGIQGIQQFFLLNPEAQFYTNNVGIATLTVTNMDGSFTNIFLPTNVVRQAVFVGVANPTNTTVQISFGASSNLRNPFRTANVAITTTSSNFVTIDPDLATIFLSDDLASETNRGLLVNFNTGNTFRPANYLFSRGVQAIGGPGNGTFTNNFFFDPTFTNRVVTSLYAGYAAFVDNVVSRPPLIPAGTVTNLPGRVAINAENLDLSRTRIRSEGLLTIKTRHLISSSNTVVDSENLSYTLASTNGNLQAQNLAKLTVDRLRGDVLVWSGFWTNQQTIITTNYIFSTTNPPVLSPLTNFVSLGFHMLMVDASTFVLVQLPVTVYDFIARSTNVTFNDAMLVAQSFLIDGESFTINGSITFSNVLTDWIFTNSPGLKFFTNNGSLTVPNELHLGDDRPTPFSAFVNRGIITAYGQNIRSDYAEITGTNFASGTFALTTTSGKIENGRIATVGDVVLTADVLKLNRSVISTSNRLDLNVTANLFDVGGSSSNSLSCRDGFRMLNKPAGGDLLGTAIQSSAPQFAAVTHIWAGEDRGETTAGFLDNVALGRLKLVVEGFDPLFIFSGAGAANGLYVDVLDLSQLATFQDILQIDPNIVIYFAAANISFTPPPLNGVPQLPEEFLDGQFGGRLRWVRDFAGPGSSVDVILNGTQTIQVNRALRNSKIIDSDGDGIPNFFDFAPFDAPAFVLNGAMVKTNQPPASAFRVSWVASPATAYQVEFTTNMPLSNWQPLLKYTNNAPTNRTVTIWDTNVPAGQLRRFYRVGYSP